jgi:hypothetical protein
MQNTRLNLLVDVAIERVANLFSNPWRRIALLTIGLLFGFFLGGSAVTSTAGQLAYWDVPAAGMITLACEFVSWYVYSRPRQMAPGQRNRRKLFVDTVNATKIGILYGLCLEAFKLNT